MVYQGRVHWFTIFIRFQPSIHGAALVLPKMSELTELARNILGLCSPEKHVMNTSSICIYIYIHIYTHIYIL